MPTIFWIAVTLLSTLGAIVITAKAKNESHRLNIALREEEREPKTFAEGYTCGWNDALKDAYYVRQAYKKIYEDTTTD